MCFAGDPGRAPTCLSPMTTNESGRSVTFFCGVFDPSRVSARRRLDSAPLGRELRRPLLIAAGLFLALYGLALLRHHTLLGSYDLAYFEQASWLLRHGHEPFVTVRGIHLLGDHGSFLMYPIAFTAGWAGIPGLLALQSAALAVGVIPLWLIGRQLVGLTPTTTTALVAAYALYPALSNVGLYDFHPEAVAVPGLLTAAYCGLSGRHLPLYAVSLATVLTAREDLAVPVAALGILIATQRSRRLGLATAAAAVAWLAFDLTTVLPHFAGGEYVQGNRFGQYGDTLGEAVRYMATHPHKVLGDAATKPNLRVIVGLFAPVLFLPFLKPKYLLPGLPLQAAYLLSNVEAAHTITAQYTVSTIPFVFLATAFALPKRPYRLVPVAAAIAFLVFATASPRHAPWNWATRDATDHARRQAADLIPKSAPVSATTRMWPLLADRKDLYPFPMPMEPYVAFSDDELTPQERLAHTEYVVLDTADEEQWTPLLRQFRDRYLAPDNSFGFQPVYDEAGIVVYRR